MISNFFKAIAVSAAVLLSTAATAMPINGVISFTGGDATMTANGSGGILKIDFNGSQVVSTANGSFTGKTGVGVTWGADPWVVGPQLPLWTLADSSFSFDILSISNNSTLVPGVVGITGQGMLHGAGFDDTAASFSFTTQNTSGTFSFSATTVPEPASLALLGLGLAGLGLSRRAKKQH